MKATHADATDALRTLESHGHTAFLAGGCVRDLLLGLEPNDYDITTSALPEEVESIFPSTIPVGKSFGVIKVVSDGRELDVATFRTDGKYSDNRRPDFVAFSSSAQEDVKRRDFTINALLMDKDGGIIDYEGGVEDIKRRVIRAVGSPIARFEEDALRMMRAIRFSLKLDFNIDPDTWAAIQFSAQGISNISGERFTEELTKMMSYGRCDTAYWLMQTSGLWDKYFPTCIGSSNNWEALFGLSRVRENEPLVLCLAILLCSAWPTSRESIEEKLVLTNDQRKTLKSITDRGLKITNFLNRDVATQRKWMQWEDLDLVIRFVDCNRRLSKYQWELDGQTQGHVFARMEIIKQMGWPAPLVTGNDLIEMGFIAGPAFSTLLENVRDEQLSGKLTDKAQVRDHLIARFPAAPRKLEDGRTHDKMSRHTMVAPCKKCRARMTFTVEFDLQGQPNWGTTQDEVNLYCVNSYGVFFVCRQCQTRIKRTGFVRMAEV